MYVSKHLCILDKSIWRSLRDIKSKKKKKNIVHAYLDIYLDFNQILVFLDFRLKKYELYQQYSSWPKIKLTYMLSF